MISPSLVGFFMSLLLLSSAPLTYIKQEEFSPRSQNSQPEGLLVRAQHEGVVRGNAVCSLTDVLNLASSKLTKLVIKKLFFCGDVLSCSNNDTGLGIAV